MWRENGSSQRRNSLGGWRLSGATCGRHLVKMVMSRHFSAEISERHDSLLQLKAELVCDEMRIRTKEPALFFFKEDSQTILTSACSCKGSICMVLIHLQESYRKR